MEVCLLAKPSKQRCGSMLPCGVSFYGGIKRVKKHLAGGFGDERLLEWSCLDDVISLESNLLLLGEERFQIGYFAILCCALLL
jgi:hypothetical protein